jgi:hypothetical protein
LKSLFLLIALLVASAVSAQVPVINSVSPSSAIVGSPQITIDILGQHLTTTTAYWNGAGLTTTQISDAEITAVVPASLLSSIGTGVITVANNAMSSGFLFHVRPLLAQVQDWSPKIFTAGAATKLTVYGQNFAAGSVIYFDWQPISTAFVSSNQLNGDIGSGFITSGRHSIQVFGGTPSSATKVLSLSTQTLAFGNEALGGTTSPSTITLTNIGPATVTFAGFSLGGVNPSEFTISANTCGATLTASATCIASITFTPAQSGLQLGIFSAASDAAGSPNSANLTGTGVGASGAIIGINPSALIFGNVPISTNSGLTLVLTDESSASYATSSIALSGTNSADFSVTPSSCSLITNANCNLSVGFIPTINGPEVATLTITDNSASNPNVIQISGTGYTPAPGATIVPSAIAFGDVVTSSASAPINTSLINSGSQTYTISAIAVGGTNSADFAITGSGNCSTSTVLAPLQACPIQATFTPSGTSTESAYIQITDNATGSPRKLTLSGTGITSAHFMALSWIASSSPSVTGYNIYRGSQSGGPFTLLTPTPISGTSYNDSAVTHLATYFYVITAVGTNPPYSPTESLNSSVVTGTIP